MPTSLPLESKQPPKPEVFEAKSNLGFMLHSPLKTSFEEVSHHFAFSVRALYLFFADELHSNLFPKLDQTKF